MALDSNRDDLFDNNSTRKFSKVFNKFRRNSFAIGRNFYFSFDAMVLFTVKFLI
jgi:hypothetical protein